MTQEYLVAFGRAGHLGRFRAADGAAFERGGRVVIRGTRGTELGDLLGPARHALPDPFIGELIREASGDDHVEARRCDNLARQLCIDAETLAVEMQLPLAVLDAEVLLDGRSAVLHVLGRGAGDLGPLLERLGEAHSMIVRLYDLAGEEPLPSDAPDHLEEFKCDKPDCGEGECTDCSTGGGCSNCSAGGIDDLAAYFAGLRDKMEQSARVPLA